MNSLIKKKGRDNSYKQLIYLYNPAVSDTLKESKAVNFILMQQNVTVFSLIRATKIQ